MNAIDLQQHLLEMRWRVLSLAADLDRLDRSGASGDPRLNPFREAVQMLLDPEADRAARVQMIFSDRSPAPVR